MRALLFLLALGACAAQNHPSAISAVGIGAGRPAELVGYLLYAREFQIYPNEEALRNGLAGESVNCVSGIFSDFERHDSLSRRFHGKKVRLIGRYVDWAPIFQERVHGDPFAATAARLQNACGGDRVFIAEDATAVE